MSGLDDLVVKWWADLNDGQRSRVKRAAEHAVVKHNVGAEGVKVLIDTRCPVGPVATKFDEDPEYAYTWPESVRQFVIAQHMPQRTSIT